MIIAATVDELHVAMDSWRRENEGIVFVPTMGNLHEGHLSLVRAAHQHGAKVVASIFVNPMQFDREDDFANYLRTQQQDLVALESENVDLVFVPDVADMYPRPVDKMTYVDVPQLGDTLEGASRPGHFRGVTTVVTRLFSLVRPDVAIFGNKDYQQLLIIKRMVDDLGLPVEIIGEPTVRETDGLAMSSRNNFLSAKERHIAPFLYETLQSCRRQIVSKESAYTEIEAAAISRLQAAGFAPDYLKIRCQSDLQVPAEHETKLVILVAAWLGKTRLIDNIELSLNPVG